MNQKIDEELQKRVEGFNAELIPLLGKFKLALGAQPIVNGTPVAPSNFLSARPQLFDDSKKEETPVTEDPAESTETKTATDITEG